MRCLSRLRRLVFDRQNSTRLDNDHRAYRLPAELECLILFPKFMEGRGVVYLDASSCSKDLLIMAEYGTRVKFVGQDECSKGACRPRVKRLTLDKMLDWVTEYLSSDTEYHKW